MGGSFGQYRLIERIACGGMGEVFKAKLMREGGFEKVVAIKRLLPSLSDRPGFERRFQVEARLAARLNHNNIVHVYDFGKIGDSFFIAMEYVDGVDLGTLLSRLVESGESLPLRDSLHLAQGICRGLDYAHRLRDESGREYGLIHRDISPSNILVGYEGEVKLTDFGLVSVGGEGQDGLLAGKIGYLPPEQVLGEPLDRRSDLYGLGLVLFEMLYGKRAYPSDMSEEDILACAAKGRIDFPDSDLPGSIVALLRRACACEKAERFSTAREMEQTLERERRSLAGSDSLPAVLRRLFPGRAGESSAAAQRTVLSTRPIAADNGKEGLEKASVSQPVEGKKKKIRPWLIAFLLLALVAAAGSTYWLGQHRKGRLTLQSQPPGASIEIDGKASGRTPATLELYAYHPLAVRLSLDKYEPWEGEVVLEADEKRPMEIVLDRSLREVRLQTDPPGASVWLSGSRLEGLTPLSLGMLPLGVKQSLQAEKEGFIPLQTEFIIEKKGEVPQVLDYALTSLFHELTVVLKPENAALFVDGRRIGGASPYNVSKLMPGREVKLCASLEGYGSVTRRVMPQELEGPVEIELKPFSCQLGLSAPEGSEIKVDGKNRGNKATLAGALKEARLIVVTPANGEGRLMIRASVRQLRGAGGELLPQASLNLGAQPWATVVLDGGEALTTPVSGLKLSKGRHKLEFGIASQEATQSLLLHLR